MLDTVIYCLKAIGPVALLIFLGWLLRRTGFIAEDFRRGATRFLFSVSLPVSLFLKVSESDILHTFNPAPAIAGLAGTLIMFGVGFLVIPRMEPDPSKYGVVIQGMYRSNFAILGLPLVSLLFGSDADMASVSLLAVLVPLYSTLAVIALTPASEQANGHHAVDWGSRVRSICTNPLILSTLLGIPFSLLGVNLHKIPELDILTAAMDHLVSLSLPLGMICVGASFSAGAAKKSGVRDVRLSRDLTVGVVSKLLISPMITLGIGYLLGCRGAELGALLVLVGGPCSVTSYVMASEMGGNRLLASKLVAYTTVLSAATIVLGYMLVM